MFCGKCGNEINAGEQFCGKCGAPVVTPFIPASETTPSPMANTVSTVPSSGNFYAGNRKTMLLPYLAGAVLYLILIPLWFVNFMKAGITIYGHSDSYSLSMHQMCQNGDTGFLSVVMVVLFILSAVLFGFIALKGTGTNLQKKMILPTITAVITFLNAIGSYISVKQQLEEELGTMLFNEMDFGLTFGGILSVVISCLLLGFCIATIVMARKRQ